MPQQNSSVPTHAVPTTVLLVTGKNANKAFRTARALHQEQLQSATSTDANKENISPTLVRENATLSSPSRQGNGQEADPQPYVHEET